jgi:carbon monoxide dehydrogenase subunit G
VASTGSVTFSVHKPPSIGSALDIRRVVRCIPGAEVLQIEDPTRVAARLRLSAGGGQFCHAGTATLQGDTAGGWILRLEPASDGPTGASLELSVKATGDDEAARAWITVTSGADIPGLTPSAARRVEIIGRRVAEQFFRNLDAAVAPVPTATVPLSENDAAPAGEKGLEQAGDLVPDGLLPSWARQATAGYVGALLVVAGLAVAVRAIRGGRRG